jgi:hypothetical protein
MTPEHLSSRVVLVDGQQGFVGETGTITTVEQDGSFSVADFVNDRVQPPKRTGRLPPENVARLARTLAAELAPALPARIGGGPTSANPRRLRVRYGGAETTLVLQPGMDPEEDGGAGLMEVADESTARVLRVWRTVQELVASR